MAGLARVLPVAALLATAFSAAADAQETHSGPRARKVISIGHYPRVDGIRINFRDRELDLVRGANITVWRPYDDYIGGTVIGAAIGLPITMAEDVRGVGVGVFGVGAGNDMRGLMLGGAGVGAGGSLRGIAVGGVGAGAGGSIRGLAVGGVGAAAGGNVRGMLVGGIGAGAGGDVRGMVIGGIGAGAGGSVRGLQVGGIGVGAGGSVRGLSVGGVGVGSGGSIRGISVGGVGVGAGGTVRGLTVGGVAVGAGGGITGVTVGGLAVGSGGPLRWVTVAGLGVGAPVIEGVAAAAMVGSDRAKGVIIAPALFRTERGGQISGVTLSSVNAVRGFQHGLSIGLVNYAERLRGVQLGGINIVRDNPAPFKVLPVINIGNSR